jgi:DNA-binding GntR family transcriptional regulator
MVELRPTRGAIVITPTPEETRRIFEARRALDAAIVSLATQNAQPTDFERLSNHLRREHASMHKVDQPSRVRLASAFHLELAAIANNAILEGYLKEIVSRSSLIVALYEPWSNASCEHHEHASIVACMEQGDPAGAIALMEQRLLELEQNICLAEPQPEPSLKDRLGL